MAYNDTHALRLAGEVYRHQRAAIDRVPGPRPHAPVTVEVLEPFWLAGGKLARVGQRIEVPADEAMVLVDCGRARRI
jgi:hypothetical protein